MAGAVKTLQFSEGTTVSAPTSPTSINFGSANLTTTGNVGIGTASPTFTGGAGARGLEIEADDRAILRLESTTNDVTAVELQARDDNTVRLHTQGSNDDLRLGTDGTDALVIDTSQNVGVKTASPNFLSSGSNLTYLTLQNSTANTGISKLLVVGDRNTSGNPVGGIEAYCTATAGSPVAGDQIGSIIFERGGADNSGQISFNVAKAGSVSEAMLIDEDGNTEISIKTMIAPSTTSTISSNTITASSMHVRLAHSSGGSADLNAITAGTDGQIIIVRTANSSHDVVVRHNNSATTGKIYLAGSTDCTLSTTADTLMLMYFTDQGAWCELSRSDNA